MLMQWSEAGCPTVVYFLLLVTIIKSQVCCEERIPLDTNLSAYRRLHVSNYWLWVASHLRLLHHDSALNRSACIPRRRSRVVRVTILLEIELWGRLVSLVSQVPSDYSNLYRQLDTTSSNFY
jgi:hypothetical protein